MCIRPDALRVTPKNGRPVTNQMPATLLRAVEKLECVRLEFAGDIAVEMPRPAFEKFQNVKDWVIEFPSSGLRIL
jgi:hypothetical protein